jgi:ATP-binding cassette subfamily B protein
MSMNYNEEQEYTKRFDLGLWKQLLKYAKPYTKQLILLAFTMIMAAGIDVVFPLMTRYAIDNFVTPGRMKGLGIYAAVYGLLVIFQAFNTWRLIDIAGKIEVSLVYDIRKTGFKRLQELSFSYYDKTPVGWIMARMTSDSQRLGETISWGLVDLTWGFAMMLGIMVVLLVMHWKLALIVLSVIPLLAVISLYFQKRILK